MGDSKQTATGDLYVIPSGLAEGVVDGIPTYVRDVLNRLDEFIVENERSARRYLKAVGYEGSLDSLTLHLLDKRAEQKDIEHFLDEKIYLELIVKVKENWQDDDKMLKYFGYKS